MKRSVTMAILLLCSAAFSSSLLPVTALNTTSAPAPQPADKTVTITNFQFSPKSLRIKAGSQVTWEVKEGTHTITADNGTFESPTLSAGQKFSYKFTKRGSYRYYCSFHGSKGGHDMAGTIVVTR